MCGICGQFNYGTLEPVSPDAIRSMADSIRHRGPDDDGYHCDGAIGLGFRRLSIIDLATGHQPMSSSNGAVWLVFNGEVYNYRELRSELVGLGHAFRTQSDTEVILQGYLRWGDGILTRLNGMFGFAIWDARARRLLIARDPMGIKVVYYQFDGGTLRFGSEIRAIRAAMRTRPEVDIVALNQFLRYRYTPAPRTLFKGIQKLAPGTSLVVENGAWSLNRWYNVKFQTRWPAPSIAEAEEELFAIYQRAVKRQLVSDVPVGLLLSGGMDSGLLLSLMRQENTEWPTFSVGYGTSFKDDEIHLAAQTAAYFSAKNVAVKLDRGQFESSLATVVPLLEEPIASSSIVPMYFVCQAAREQVKVALMGQGPDELLGGYRRHIGVRYAAEWRRLPDALRGLMKRAIAILPRVESLKRAVYSLDVDDRLKRYQNVFSLGSADAIDGLFIDGMLPPGAGDEVLAAWSGVEPQLRDLDELSGFNFLEVSSSLPDELLMYADKMSMAHGLEVRVPFLDLEVVDYVMRLPQAFKVRGGAGKWLHRRICARSLPEFVMSRKKRGFAVNVVDDWFSKAYAGRMDGIFRDPQSPLFRHVRFDRVNALYDDHARGRQDNHKILFSLIVLEEWLRSYVS